MASQQPPCPLLTSQGDTHTPVLDAIPLPPSSPGSLEIRASFFPIGSLALPPFPRAVPKDPARHGLAYFQSGLIALWGVLPGVSALLASAWQIVSPKFLPELPLLSELKRGSLSTRSQEALPNYVCKSPSCFLNLFMLLLA